MKFTAQQALDASEAGDPILLTERDVARLLRAHNATSPWPKLSAHDLLPDPDADGRWDAWAILAWLGY